jgi:prepilin-type N-terminal cleavage/methylation domain-containing protein
MIPLRACVRNQRGFALAELLVAVAVMGLVMAGVFVVQRGGQQAYLLGSNRVETQQNARVVLDLMTRELRSARSITTITGCANSVCTDLTFVDQNGQTVRYALAGTTLNRTVGGTTTALIGGAQSLAMTSYSVYDVSSATYTKTVTPAQVTVIKISATIKTEESVAANSSGDQRATMESTIRLRLSLS